MELLIKTFLLGSLVLISGCNAAKEVTDEQQNRQQMTEQNTKDYSSEGFSKIMMVLSEESECPFVMVLEESKERLDPLNLDEGKFSELKNAEQEAWIKFRRLRRTSRCPNTSPVQLLEIKN
ncbi:MAG: hypothetical protein HKO67_07140 [Flavobacteriaceae bacterium]|nr:hypothetical protein [Flavobacteriaceae bacterium]